jgi:cobalamin biosynthesis protein CobD/CbiB
MTQRKFEKIMLMCLASVVMSVICYLLINNLITSINLFEYILIEFILVFAYKSYTFVVKHIHAIEE